MAKMLSIIGAARLAEREAMPKRNANAKRDAAIKAVCRLLAGRLPRSCGSRKRASCPLRSPAGWGSAGRASIGCWVGRQLVSRRQRDHHLW